MSEPLTPDPGTPVAAPPHQVMDDAKTMPTVVYVLYLLGFASSFVTTIVGVIIAYNQKPRAGEIARSHYVFLIRTAWIALVWLALAVAIWLVGVPLTLILVGLAFWWAAGIMVGLLGVWFVVRCVVGLIFVSRNEAYPRPQAWLI